MNLQGLKKIIKAAKEISLKQWDKYGALRDGLKTIEPGRVVFLDGFHYERDRVDGKLYRLRKGGKRELLQEATANSAAYEIYSVNSRFTKDDLVREKGVKEAEFSKILDANAWLRKKQKEWNKKGADTSMTWDKVHNLLLNVVQDNGIYTSYRIVPKTVKAEQGHGFYMPTSTIKALDSIRPQIRDKADALTKILEIFTGDLQGGIEGGKLGSVKRGLKQVNDFAEKLEKLTMAVQGECRILEKVIKDWK